jgi:hypothetical protein
MRGRRRRNRTEIRNWSQRVEKREKVNPLVSALVPLLPLNAFSFLFCSVTLPYLFSSTSSLPLSPFFSFSFLFPLPFLSPSLAILALCLFVFSLFLSLHSFPSLSSVACMFPRLPSPTPSSLFPHLLLLLIFLLLVYPSSSLFS